jgi:hypothetical protein
MSDFEIPLILPAQLKALAQAQLSRSCTCAMGACTGWESVPGERWPAAQVSRVGSLRASDSFGPEPTYEEFHPHNTRYDAPDAPIAPAFFPYNRCDVFTCGRCDRVLLKYTEYGGYYIDDRVRAVQADLVTDAQPEA